MKLWEEGLTVPESYGQTMWLMLSSCSPGAWNVGVRGRGADGTGCNKYPGARSLGPPWQKAVPGSPAGGVKRVLCASPGRGPRSLRLASSARPCLLNTPF